MIHREMNRKVLFIFILCAVSITTANWVLHEKFIADARISYFVNCAIALCIAFLYSKLLEGRLNRSIDMLMSKIRSISKGDLTQRFKEDPDEVLPYGLSFELGEMMKFLRESIGGLWKLSALLVKQLGQLVIATQEALDEFKSEVSYLAIISENLESVRNETIELARKFSDLDVNASSDLIAMKQVDKTNDARLNEIKGYKSLISKIADDIGDFSFLTDTLDSVLVDFQELSHNIGEISESMAGISTESGLVKLNASIDAAQKQAHGENYQKLIIEVENILEKMSTIAHSSSGVSTFAENRITELSKNLKATKKSLKTGAKDTEKVERFFEVINEQSLKASTVNRGALEKIRNLCELMNTVNVKREVFSKTIKTSIDHFDKLKSDTQITLLKFSQLDDKIDVIKVNLMKLEEFKNSYQIA